MSKSFKISLIIIIVLIIMWFVPIIPLTSDDEFGIPGCNSLVTKTLRSMILPDQSEIIPIARTSKIEFPFVIFTWGDCSIIN